MEPELYEKLDQKVYDELYADDPVNEGVRIAHIFAYINKA